MKKGAAPRPRVGKCWAPIPPTPLGSCLVIQPAETGTWDAWALGWGDHFGSVLSTVVLCMPQPGWTCHRTDWLEALPFCSNLAASPTGFIAGKPHSQPRGIGHFITRGSLWEGAAETQLKHRGGGCPKAAVSLWAARWYSSPAYGLTKTRRINTALHDALFLFRH